MLPPRVGKQQNGSAPVQGMGEAKDMQRVKRMKMRACMIHMFYKEAPVRIIRAIAFATTQKNLRS
jgi:hypothetical protein